MENSETVNETKQEPAGRRGFIATLFMIGGIAVGYGTGLLHFFRFLVPLQSRGKRREFFVGTLKDIPVGKSRTVKTPGGEEITLARVSSGGDRPATGFKALSTKCPHLGCKVHWVPSDSEFFCPCHNGAFDKDGIAIKGPPAKEGKNLSQYEVRVQKDNGWVFVMLPERKRYGA